MNRSYAKLNNYPIYPANTVKDAEYTKLKTINIEDLSKAYTGSIKNDE